MTVLKDGITVEVEPVPGRDAFLMTVNYTFDIVTAARSPAVPVVCGVYDVVERMVPLMHVWEPDLRQWEPPDLRCTETVGAIHCSLVTGHAGAHRSKTTGVYWH